MDDRAAASAVDPGPDTAAARPSPAPRRRSRLLVLGAALLVVIGAIAYLVTNHHSSSAPTATTPPTTTVPDATIVAAVNLRLSDLPPGWATAGPTVPAIHFAPAPPATTTQALTTLSACLGVPTASAAGLCAGAALPGQTAGATSPTYAQSADPEIQMHSVTATIGTEAQAQTYAAPFENADFVACYGQFQRTLAAAAVPGASATVEAVTLPPPAGVKAFGYITTVTSSHGTEVFGQAYMLGGRIVSDLMPATNGPQIPGADFTRAYDAMGGEIAANAQK
ncbi:MAG: hypothetical protein JO368_08035 [Acidimicrobiales bacterium]|nr:hypothetical protein [Acidimicrobiales bacterium]